MSYTHLATLKRGRPEAKKMSGWSTKWLKNPSAPFHFYPSVESK
ncbi:hypothetical protein [Bacillus sp. mrc49]|nr:hypothetical protein [Bacillus sp. mrc49]